MSFFRRLHPDAHMGPLRIVEVYDSFQYVSTLDTGFNMHFVQPLRLEYAIGALRYRVLQRVTALRHTDGDSSSLEFTPLASRRYFDFTCVLISIVTILFGLV